MKSKTQLAIENGRTIYTNNVYDSIFHNGWLLKVSNNKKLGKAKIVKGRHKNKFIYLTGLIHKILSKNQKHPKGLKNE